jgi:hypothetical protein
MLREFSMDFSQLRNVTNYFSFCSGQYCDLDNTDGTIDGDPFTNSAQSVEAVDFWFPELVEAASMQIYGNISMYVPVDLFTLWNPGCN